MAHLWLPYTCRCGPETAAACQCNIPLGTGWHGVGSKLTAKTSVSRYLKVAPITRVRPNAGGIVYRLFYSQARPFFYVREEPSQVPGSFRASAVSGGSDYLR